MIESGGITWLFNDEFYPFNGAIRAINEAADLVGFEKLMWGSDYPRTITAITYKMSYDFVIKSKELEERSKKLFLGENAKAFYGFKNLPELPYIKTCQNENKYFIPLLLIFSLFFMWAISSNLLPTMIRQLMKPVN